MGKSDLPKFYEPDLQIVHLSNMQETETMSGQAASRVPRVDCERPGQMVPPKSKLTSLYQWLQVWERIVTAEVLRVLEPRRRD